MRFLVPYHLDEQQPELEVPLVPDAVITVDLPEVEDRWIRMATLYEAVAQRIAEAVRAGDRPVVASADCTTSLGVLAGLQRAGVDPGVVWFDAHGDLQTLETTTSGYLGAMPLRMLTGYRRELLADRIGLRDIAEERVLLAGGRDLDPPEVAYLRTAEMRHRPVDDLGDLPEGPLYLHLDCDVIDPAELPGLHVPAGNGPSLRTVSDAVHAILATGRVAAFGIACTWQPGLGNADRLRPMVEAGLRR